MPASSDRGAYRRDRMPPPVPADCLPVSAFPGCVRLVDPPTGDPRYEGGSPYPGGTGGGCRQDRECSRLGENLRRGCPPSPGQRRRQARYPGGAALRCDFAVHPIRTGSAPGGGSGRLFVHPCRRPCQVRFIPPIGACASGMRPSPISQEVFGLDRSPSCSPRTAPFSPGVHLPQPESLLLPCDAKWTAISPRLPAGSFPIPREGAAECGSGSSRGWSRPPVAQFMLAVGVRSRHRRKGYQEGDASGIRMRT